MFGPAGSFLGEEITRFTGVLGLADHGDSPARRTDLVAQSGTPGMMGPIDRHGLWWLIAFGVDARSAEVDPCRLVRGALGRDLPVEVVSTDPWTARMELLDRSGRVFLVGDAGRCTGA